VNEEMVMRKKPVSIMLLVGFFSILTSSFASAAKFNKGDIVKVYNTGSVGLVVRSPGACDGKIGVKFDTDLGIVLDGPVYCNSYYRWKVRWQDGIEGWSAEGYPGGVDYLKKKYITPSTKLSIGDRVKANTGDGSNLTVRTDGPELAYKGSVSNGAEGTVIGGPFYGVPKGSSGFYYFWKINYGLIEGYSAENYLEKVINLPPTCSLSVDKYSGNAPLTVTFSMNANDPDGSISVWGLDIDGDGDAEYTGAGNPPSAQPHTYTSPGTYSVVLMVLDNDGANAFDTETIVVGENNPPTCGLSPDRSSGKAPLTVAFSMSAGDADGWITSWELLAGDGSAKYTGTGNPPSTKTHTYTTSGTYTAILGVTDNGGATTFDTKTITVYPPNQSPTCSLSASPQSGKAPLTVTFSLGANDPDGSISAWVLDVDGDGNADYSGTGNPPSTQEYRYTTEGGYTAALMVSDNDGATASDVETVNVGPTNAPPTCSLSVNPKSGNAPLEVTFSMSANDSDGYITTWVLDAGDEHSYSGNGNPPSTLQHTYTSQDSYTAVLAVSDDDDATDFSTETISVSAPTQLPSVSTSEASDIDLMSVTLNGNLGSTGGETCQVWFEWGLTTSYGHSTFKQSKSSAGSFSESISGLSSGTTYHFRACATNSKGIVYGSDGTFSTLTLPDLIIEDMSVEPDPPVVGASITVGIKIKNKGSADAVGVFFVEFYFDDIYLGRAYVGDLAAGATEISCWGGVVWPSDANLHAIKGVVDPDNSIIETNEGNNELSIYLQPVILSGNLSLREAIPANVGEFGLTNEVEPYVDPLYLIDPPNLSDRLSETFGNNIETEEGWIRVQDPISYQKGYILKGQWSRQGTYVVPWDLRLFGDSIRTFQWHTRRLETTSQGSLNICGLEGSDIVPLHVRLECDSQVDGLAMEDSAMIMLNWGVDWAKRAAESLLAPGVQGLKTFTKEVAENTIKHKILEAIDTGIQWFPEESRFKAFTEALLTLKQDGPYFGLQPPPIFDGVTYSMMGGHKYETTGYVQRWRQHLVGDWTVDFDPKQPVEFTIKLITDASIKGGAETYAGIRGYRLQFDLPKTPCLPLIIEHRDPLPERTAGAFYKTLLVASAQTPELVSGSIEILESLGMFSPSVGDKFIVLNNSASSGFLIPLTINATNTNLTIRAGSLVSNPGLADKAGMQIVFLYEKQFYPILDADLDNMFSYFRDSGIPEMPYASALRDFAIDITSLPRGDGIFLIALGNMEESDLQASLIVDSILLSSEGIPGDFNLDSDVDLTDLAVLFSRWLEENCNYPAWCGGTDLDYSGFIDFMDFAELTEHWGD